MFAGYQHQLHFGTITLLPRYYSVIDSIRYHQKPFQGFKINRLQVHS